MSSITLSQEYTQLTSFGTKLVGIMSRPDYVFRCTGSNVEFKSTDHFTILGKWPTWRTIPYYVFIFILNSLHVSSTTCSSSGETNCVNTTSGNCHSMSVAVSCACRKFTADLHMTRPPTVTRGCVDTIFLSWWWAPCARNMYRVKNKNKYIVKNCASRWSFTKNHNMMHGQ
jgi:hypothetical protein